MLLCHYFIIKEDKKDSDIQDKAYLIGKYEILNQCIQSIKKGTTDDVENKQSLIHYALKMYSTLLENL